MNRDLLALLLAPFVAQSLTLVPRSLLLNRTETLATQARAVGVFLGIGGGVPPGSPNPDPISDQKVSFSTPVFRPGL